MTRGIKNNKNKKIFEVDRKGGPLHMDETVRTSHGKSLDWIVMADVSTQLKRHPLVMAVQSFCTEARNELRGFLQGHSVQVGWWRGGGLMFFSVVRSKNNFCSIFHPAQTASK